MGAIRQTRPRISKPTLATQIAWRNPLTNGLVVCFPFNEMSGGKVSNIAPGGLGTSSTVPWTANGLLGAGTASGKKFTLDVSPWGNLVQYTLAFGFLKTALGGSVTNGGLFRDNGSTGNYGWWVNDGGGAGTGKLWGRHNNTNVVTSATGPNVTDGKPHNMAVTWDGSNAQLWLDGFTFGSALSTGTSPGLVAQIWVGQQSGDEFFGDIFYWYGWNRALNATEVFSLAANPYQIFQPATGTWRYPNTSAVATTLRRTLFSRAGSRGVA